MQVGCVVKGKSDGNKLGGSPDPRFAPSTCACCGKVVKLVTQLYQTDGKDQRVSGLFSCTDFSCKDQSIVCLRYSGPVKNVVEITTSKETESKEDGDNPISVCTDELDFEALLQLKKDRKAKKQAKPAKTKKKGKSQELPISSVFSGFEENLIMFSDENWVSDEESTWVGTGPTRTDVDRLLETYISENGSSGATLDDEEESTVEKWLDFRQRLDYIPGQCIRYEVSGEVLWNHPVDTPDPCSCGKDRVFEFQVLPGAHNYLRPVTMTWSSLVVFTCPDDQCGYDHVVEDAVIRLVDPDDQLLAVTSG